MSQVYRNIKINSNIIFANLDDKEGLLIDLRSHKYYILNDTAWCIWMLITKGLCLEKITKIVEDRYNIAPCKFKKYIYKAIKEMRKLKLIKLTK